MTKSSSDDAPVVRPSLRVRLVNRLTREAPPPGDNLSATIAKWLVPSATVLFGVIGYVIQNAQSELLGLPTDSDKPSYFSSAADFLRDIVTIAVDCLIGLLHLQLPMAGHFWILLPATLLTAAVLGGSWWSGIAARWRGRAVLAVLGCVLAWKFIALDAPLSKVSNVIIGLDQSGNAPEESGSLGQTFTQRLAASGHGSVIEAHLAERAKFLYDEVICSRISADAAQLHTDFRDSAVCRRGQPKNRDGIRGEFISQLWATGLIALLAVALLRLPASSRIGPTMAIIALGYSLTVPYAYGKLMKSTYFDFGLLHLAGDTAATPKAYGALVLSRGSAGANLLIATEHGCSNSPESGWTTTMSSISASQIVSIEQIYRQDVITWSVLNEHDCPVLAAPGTKGRNL